MKNSLFAIVIVLVLGAYGQDSFVIQKVKVFDGENVIENTTVRIENGVIAELGESVAIKEKDSVINGKGKTLIPALSNAHVHAWSPQTLEQAAKAGVLNVMDMHGVEPYQVTMRQLKDSTNYARYFVAGYAATAPEGHGTQFGFPVPTLNGPEDAKSFIEGRVKANVDYIKIIVEPWKSTLNSETVAEVIKEAHKANKIAVVHVSRLDDALDVISNNADGLVHIWWDKPMNDEQLKRLKKDKDFFIIPTLLTTFKAFESMGEAAQNYMTEPELLAHVKKMHGLGIPILAGTDPPNLGINYGDDLYQEMQLLNDAGLSPVEVLQCATSNISKAFGLENMGFIRKGFLADMILIDGDITVDLNALENINTIWKEGKRIER